MLKKMIAVLFTLVMIISVSGCNNTTSGNTTDPFKSVEGNINDVTLKEGDKYAVISIKDYGDITVKLFPEAAPKGVENFIKLANEGFYNNKTFHRIMEDFMMQGGAASAEEDSKYEKFDIETNVNCRHFYGALCYANALGKNTTQFYIVNNKKPNDLSRMSTSTIENYAKMYRQQADSIDDKTSNAYIFYDFQAGYYERMGQFLKDAEKNEAITKKYMEKGGSVSLDGNYTVFGQTIEGFDVIDAIAKVEVTTSSADSTEKSKPVKDVIIDTVTIKEYHA